MTDLRGGITGSVRGSLSADALWTPAALGSSLLAMWDAERSDLITQSGGAVSSWRDVVAGYEMAQTTPAARPTYSATSFNNRPGITFDGVQQFLEAGAIPLPAGAAPCEVWALVDQTAPGSDATGRRIFSYGSGTNDTREIYRITPSGLNRLTAAIGNGATRVFPDSPIVDFSGRRIARMVITSTECRLEVDGTSAAAAAVVPATVVARARIGASANAATAANFYQGGLSIALMTGALTTEQAAMLYAYLGARR
ncbi:hypothetical protein [Phenylobacterium deserti]|uniref:LamG domain-containing protein n=1 Tax=Phenylobacterium deserti TaxID=1914756 RepID=A0A328ABM7_9CAUL|nr:hypothetical protein [Phenylobacterium deserti]RAK52132.1 hypothetical protein DJ018_13330 [Phenylobacterium deserti]